MPCKLLKRVTIIAGTVSYARARYSSNEYITLLGSQELLSESFRCEFAG